MEISKLSIEPLVRFSYSISMRTGMPESIAPGSSPLAWSTKRHGPVLNVSRAPTVEAMAQIIGGRIPVQTEVVADGVACLILQDNPPILQDDPMLAERLNCCHVVTDKQDGASFMHYLSHFAETFFLKRGVTDRQHFVNQEDIGLEVRRYGEREARIHAAQ